MKPEQNIIDKILDGIIRAGRPGRIVVEGRDLFDVLSKLPEEEFSQKKPGKEKPDQKKDENRREKIKRKYRWLMVRLKVPGNRRLHFSLAVAIAFMMLVVSVWYGVFFIKDVILHETEFTTNEQGAIVPKKPLGGEYALYLFNTSDIWANPGIQVNERDRIRISISGGFHSSIEDVLDASANNVEPEFQWVFPDKIGIRPETPQKWDWAVKYCLSQYVEDRADYFYFGSVMYTIQPESADFRDHPHTVKPEEIRAWRPKRGFQRIRKSGYLLFSVNDLFFEDANAATIYYEKLNENLANDSLLLCEDISRFAKEGKTASLRMAEFKLESIPKDIEDNNKEKAAVLEDPAFPYKDNLGQLLVAVEIKRVLTPFILRWPEVFFREFETSYRWVKESLRTLKTKCFIPAKPNGTTHHCYWLYNLLVEIIYVILWIIGVVPLFFLFGALNTIMLGVWAVLLCFVICFIMQLLYWGQRCRRDHKKVRKAAAP